MTAQQKTSIVAQIVDEDEFLLQLETRTKKVARTPALGEVFEGLTKDHWKVIDCVRQYYLQFGTVPPVRLVVRRTGSSLPHIRGLFPHGYMKGVCKVAGIPRNTVKVAPMHNSHRG